MRISDWSSDVCSSDLIGLIAGAEHHAVTATEELGEIAFQCAVTGIAAVGDARAGGAGAERLYRAHRFFDAVRIEGQAEIIVGAEQDDAPTVDYTFGCRFNTIDADGKRIMRAAAEADWKSEGEGKG